MASLPKTSDGKRRRVRRSFETKSEAAAFLAEGSVSSEAIDVAANLTVNDLLVGWQGWIKRRVEGGHYLVWLPIKR
jgi:hypothetical protein